ncbi:MAG: hypothetical protein HYR94_25655 [Chloroflexi bacterium]|nr:hypothetical protein [Chloroflexota bacterium]
MSRIGQLIGGAFEEVVIAFVKTYLTKAHPDYEVLNPKKGKKLITLEMSGGSRRQLDTIVTPKGSDDPVALLEAKWLKDARHWNDKGAWILQLREIKKKHATVRGVAAILAGYWKEGVGVLLQNEGCVRMVLVATDEEVYDTLQPYLDKYLGDDTFQLDAKRIQSKFPEEYIEDFYNFMNHLNKTGTLQKIAQTWLNFNRQDKHNKTTKGATLIEAAIDELLAPLPGTLPIQNFEISLQIETGNIIYEKFEDLEDLLNFIQEYSQNPAKILERITPKKRQE